MDPVPKVPVEHLRETSYVGYPHVLLRPQEVVRPMLGEVPSLRYDLPRARETDTIHEALLLAFVEDHVSDTGYSECHGHRTAHRVVIDPIPVQLTLVLDEVTVQTREDVKHLCRFRSWVLDGCRHGHGRF